MNIEAERALIREARARAEAAAHPCPCGNEACSGAPLWSNHICPDSEGVPCEAPGCEVCKTDPSDVPALCDLAEEQAREIERLRADVQKLEENRDRSFLDGASQMRDRAAAVIRRARETGEADHRSMLHGIRSLILVLSPGESDIDEEGV